MTSFLPDLRFAVRMLWKHKALTASAIATISLAIAANTAIFTLVSSVLLRPLPLPTPDQLVRVQEIHGHGSFNLSGATFRDVSDQARAFAAIASYRLNSPGLATGAMPEQVLAAEVSREYFRVLGVAPALGRGFEPADFAPGARRTIVLTDGVWHRSFGADRSVVGRTISVNAVPTEVIGVMPPRAFAPGSPQVWLPQTPASALPLNRRAHLFTVIGRLHPGTTPDTARGELAALSTEILAASGAIDPDMSLRVTPLQEQLVQSARPALLMLWAAVGVLLLIGATNVANLLLMQGTARAREISIRTALGAARGRILRQFVTESLLLGMAAGVLGTLLGMWSVPVLRALLPAVLAQSVDIAVGIDTIAFAFLLSLVAVVLFGSVPSIRLSASAPADALRDRHDDSPARSWLRTAFVTAQVALTVVLLAGGGLLARSFLLVTRVNPGFDPSQTLAFDLTLPSASYPNSLAHGTFLSSAVEGMRQVPGIQSAGATGALPMSGTASTGMAPEGGDPNAHPVADVIPISPGLLETLRVPLARGRLFSHADDRSGVRVMLINETAAREFWPAGIDPVGRKVTMLDWGQPYTAEVIGVVGDVHQSGPDVPVSPAVYYPVLQFPETLLRYSIVVRATGDPVTLAGAARDQVWRLDRNLPVASIRTMNDVLGTAVAQRRFNFILVGAFSAAALALAALGLYGILAFAVGQRTREFGVRIALGAGARDVARVVWRHGATPVFAGLGLGLFGAFAASRAIQGLLFEVQATDGATMTAVAGLVILAAAFASIGPIRRALTIDPAAVLRG